MKKREKEIDHLVEDYFRYDHKTGIIYNKINRINVKKNQIAGCKSTTDNYWYIKIHCSRYTAHRLAWRLYYGKWPEKYIDHISGNKTDNRICNLRVVNKRQNCINTNHHRNGRLPGTNYSSKDKKYISRIKIKGKPYYLGIFENEIDAHNCYLKACKAIEKRKFKSAKELREYIKNMK